MFCRSAADLGSQLPPLAIGGQPIVPGRFLGSGATAAVYAAQYRGQSVVLKFFRPEHVATCKCEVANLRLVAKLGSAVSKLVAVSADHRLLLCTPVGRPFKRHPRQLLSRHDDNDDSPPFLLPAAEDFCDLVDILKQVHTKSHLVHRDLAWGNFFRNEANQMFLNDWSTAVPAKSHVQFSGALQLAPDHILKALKEDPAAEYTAQFSDDLEMVVKAVYGRSVVDFETIARTGDAGQLLSLWESALQRPGWQSMLKAARVSDYEKLKQLISTEADLRRESGQLAVLPAPNPHKKKPGEKRKTTREAAM